MDDFQSDPKHITAGLPMDPSPPDFVFLFPLEIQEMIIYSLYPNDGEWADTATLKSCALVCRNWRRVVPQVLYTRVQVFGRKNYKLLEMNLKKDPSIGRHMHTLCIHDVTPAERASLGALHTLPRITHLQIKELFIIGALIPSPAIPSPTWIHGPTVTFPDRKSYPQHCHFLIPFQNTLLADLPRFTSLQHLHLYQIRMKSLDGLRKILGSLPNLNSAHLRNVWWGDPDADFRPLHNATSWHLSQFSLINCTQDYVAPFFWAIPPESEQTKRKIHEGRRSCHPGICVADVVPLVKLADFVLEPESSPELRLARAFCWQWGWGNDWVSEWGRGDKCASEQDWGLRQGEEFEWHEEDGPNGCGDISFLSVWDILTKSRQGFLRCSVDAIDIGLDGYQDAPSFLCFHFESTTSFTPKSDCNLERIVGIRIFSNGESIDAEDRENMELILCEFQELRRLKLDNFEFERDERDESVPFAKLGRTLERRGVPTSEGPLIILCGGKYWMTDNKVEGIMLDPVLSWIKSEEAEQHQDHWSCFRVRAQIADSRFLILSSLVRLMVELLSRSLWKEAERVREGLLQVQRELTHYDQVKYVHLVNKTLHSMFHLPLQINNDPDRRDDVDKFFSTKVENLLHTIASREAISSFGNAMCVVHIMETLTEAASSYHELGDSEMAIKFWVQVVDVCAQRARHNLFPRPATVHPDADFAPSKYSPCLANTIRNLALHSPQNRTPLSAPSPSQTRLWKAWAELARQDATYTPYLEDVLENQLLYLFRHGTNPLLSSFVTYGSYESTDTVIYYEKATLDVWRGLAESDPMVYTPHLAKALKDMISYRLNRTPFEWKPGGLTIRYPNPEDYAEEVMIRWRNLMDVWGWLAKHNFAYAPSFADALVLAASKCSQVQKHYEVVKFRREAVGIWRELAQRDNTGYGFRLENSLHQLALALYQLPSRGSIERTPFQYEAINIWQELIVRNASAYVDYLVRSLHETSYHLFQLEYQGPALAFYSEAVAAWRSRARDNSAAFESSYLLCLHTVSWLLSSFNRDMEAVPLIAECVSGFRRLAQDEVLYMCLDTQSVVLVKVHQFELAVAASQESVQGFRSLVNFDFHRYYPGLARAVHHLSVHLEVLGQEDQALGAVEEAFFVYRKLRSVPSRSAQIYAGMLRRYAFLLRRVGRFEEAMKASDEASDIEKVFGSWYKKMRPLTQV
ncbi:hypothetical protein NLI96_g8874 [Meripilus lineatus]|uniref:F-box domain-containing protein n=1 Tax=Meripilus lineatus TaxID=2056292 RepID=A0AAD5UY54_9APHY|nr:hypothetical protein NLI96_g8874 [Physisporinus lineatus]